MSDVLYRHWVMLQLIPRSPRKVSVQIINKQLNVHGYETTDRTIQRDLIKLSKNFPLISDERDKPFGWSWSKDAPVYDLPSMDINTAMTFYLSEKFLDRLMPPEIINNISSHIKLAGNVLDGMKGKKLKQWRNKVRVLSRTQHLLPPEIEETVIDTVYQALLMDKQFYVTYHPRHGEEQEYEVSPRGLVIRDQVIYLVATLWGYSDIKQLVLHRMSDIKLLDKTVKKISFNLDTYIQSGEFDYIEQDKSFRLKLLINKYIAKHLQETPLSEDQVIKKIDDSSSILTATVKDTQQLRWWILGFGEGIEVKQPAKLRKEMIQVVQAMSDKYNI
jgi:predicted DNA-binding transcriptional regulator YafY